MITTGNIELLKLPKTAFLCSRQVPASAVLKCYDWALEQRQKGVCVISGFHSQIEKDVLHYLLKGTQPIIVVLARGLKEKLEPEFEKPLQENRLLILSPFLGLPQPCVSITMSIGITIARCRAGCAPGQCLGWRGGTPAPYLYLRDIGGWLWYICLPHG